VPFASFISAFLAYFFSVPVVILQGESPPENVSKYMTASSVGFLAIALLSYSLKWLKNRI
jgi:hypothetical protein